MLVASSNNNADRQKPKSKSNVTDTELIYT